MRQKNKDLFVGWIEQQIKMFILILKNNERMEKGGVDYTRMKSKDYL
jgi:hypothetical protein